MDNTITVNGVSHAWQSKTVAALLAEHGKDPEAKGIAVALNGGVLPRTEWNATKLSPGDQVEIVTVIRGG